METLLSGKVKSKVKNKYNFFLNFLLWKKKYSTWKKNLRVQNIFETHKSENLINQTESCYNTPCLDEKMELFFKIHQIKVHFGSTKHLRDRINYWKKPGYRRDNL